MALLHYLWSRTAASNATADSNVNWQEGQSPSSVNDSARSMMASLAGYRDDIAGAIVTGGTSTAYTVSSYQVFDTLAHMNGQAIAFTPHATNGATVTLNVDSLGAKPLRSAPSTELLAGTLILGTPYLALYNHSDQVFYLHGFYGNPYNIPLAGGIDYWGTTAPNSSFVFPVGQAISRSTYSALFSIMGTTHGSGDGSTTFNLPDKRGRVSAAADAMGGNAASRLTDALAGIDALGDAGGTQTHTLTLGELPTGITSATSGAVTVNFGGTVPRTTGTVNNQPAPSVSGNPVPYSSDNAWVGITSASTPGAVSVTSNNTSGNAHSIVQPTIVCNYIMRII